MGNGGTFMLVLYPLFIFMKKLSDILNLGVTVDIEH